MIVRHRTQSPAGIVPKFGLVFSLLAHRKIYERNRIYEALTGLGWRFPSNWKMGSLVARISACF
jgi:hypothetical protein